MSYKAVILIGGPQKGTRFRPLSLEFPKPLFPVAGFPIIHHHIEACSKVEDLREILIIGFYQPSEALSRFLTTSQREFNVNIRYLQEYTSLGTAGGLYHFRDQILSGQPRGFFVFNGDLCCKFPLLEMLEFHKQQANGQHFTLLATEAPKSQSLNYGCLVKDPDTHEVLHYVEKPQTYVSSIINCGLYVFTPEIFEHISTVFKKNQDEIFNGDPFSSNKDTIRLEQDIFSPLAGTGKLFAYNCEDLMWSQIKSAGSAIYANRLYLGLYHDTHPERLAKDAASGPHIIGDVFIHSTARVDPTATLGPNVTIGAGVLIGPGVRVRESIILEGANLQDHCCILHSIVGWNSVVGAWSRVEGTPKGPNPNDKFAKMDSDNLFDDHGRLTPSITILGCNVAVPAEVIILNSIVLPHKDLSYSIKNQILL
ncbi:mannose-1-phosphate guanyltransferase alpha-A-like isoform X1 [Acanthaster planci]|uniref:Mannose-1-phosphate guanyltransferase alpha-A-like isoform X1 n=1 Tax=Acanthaster planci TaxID=133434 RepID=A0A8B8A742_ACAPL|nr:mannose-1-phosphate guanyltransferase alpha-A-like isoform X1 [Acanthaster planci]XP_022111843.1 mannose-1-phosphate guanyltransferase alpha-A-like isoform X1 [Acanthaster planci]